MEGAKTVGGWICTKDEKCPFVKQNISKMVLDLYTTSSRMFLVGSDRFLSLKKPIRAYLENNGVLETPIR